MSSFVTLLATYFGTSRRMAIGIAISSVALGAVLGAITTKAEEEHRTREATAVASLVRPVVQLVAPTEVTCWGLKVELPGYQRMPRVDRIHIAAQVEKAPDDWMFAETLDCRGYLNGQVVSFTAQEVWVKTKTRGRR